MAGQRGRPEDREEAEGGRLPRASGRVGSEGTPLPRPEERTGESGQRPLGPQNAPSGGYQLSAGSYLFSLDRSSSLCVAAL